MPQHPEFKLDTSICYLNHAGVSPWPLRTIEAINQFAQENLNQGASHYPAWMHQETLLRQRFQQLLNAPSANDISLVKNTSEALSFVAYGLNWQHGDNVVLCDCEFPSNRVVWESLRQFGVITKQVRFSQSHSPENDLMQACDSRTRLLTVSSVQYASGLRMDLETLGRFCRDENILFCVDAIQSVGAVNFDLQASHVDFAMADGHKWMLAPEGLGFFYCRNELRNALKLNQFGWHMLEHPGDYENPSWQVASGPTRFECGSPNMLGIHALNASLSLLLEIGMKSIEESVVANARYITEKVKASRTLQLISTDDEHRLAGIVTFKHISVDSKKLYQLLMQQKVICAHRHGGVRFSPHFYTSQETIDKAFEIIKMI